MFCKGKNKHQKWSLCILTCPLPSMEEYRITPPGQIHAAIREAGRRIKVLSAGSQDQVNTPFITDPVLGFSFMGYTSEWIYGTGAAVHHLPS